MAIPITQGSGQTSIASEKIGNNDFQQVEIYGGGGASVLSVNPDGSFQASIIGIPAVKVQGSIAVAIISGSIAATFTPPANQSVSGTVQTDVRGSVAVAIISGSIAATFTPPANQSVSGTVGASIIGLAPIQWSNSSLLTITTSSVITAFGQSPSIVGTYAEDAPSASGDKGFLVMGARNDTLSSVTSNDGDYSSHVVGPAGELIAENAPLTKWISGTASMLGGVPLTSSVTVIAAQGSSVFTYITGVQVANLGSASVLVSFFGGTSSLIGYTIAPAGGGSNIYYENGIKTNANSAFSASVSGTASIFVSAQGFTSKT